MVHLAVRLDYAAIVSQRPDVAHRLAEICVRPELSILGHVSARKVARNGRPAKTTAATVERYLLDETNEAIALDNGPDGELVATAKIESGPHANAKSPAATRFMTYLAIPFERAELSALLATIFDIASVVDAATGFIAAEVRYGLAQSTAIGHSIPRERPGLSAQRSRERQVRDYKNELIDTRLAGIEWGTFLGAGHRAHVDLEALRRSGVFERVVELSPNLAFLQLTETPEDDLSPAIEERLTRARQLLSAMLLDTSDLPAPPNDR